MSVSQSLSALRDVAGVHGSFVIRLTGELVGKDLPPVFSDELFLEVGARLARFVETMAADGDEVASAILRFEDHRLYVSRFGSGLLAVITTNDVNAAALRMALTLTMRRLEPELLQHLTAPAMAMAPAPESGYPPLLGSAGPPSVGGAPRSIPGASRGPASSGPRTYRGRPIG